MPFVFDSSLATPGNLTTNATPNTETDAFFLKPGATRAVYFAALQLQGKGAGLTQLTGIMMRIRKLATASTGGVGITPNPTDPNSPAASATAASRPAIGATPLNHLSIGCSASGPGWWSAFGNQDAMPMLPAANAGSIDGVDSAGLASMAYEFSFQHME